MSGSAVVDLRETFGAAFIGLLVSTVLYGVTVAQIWTYYWHYGGRDPRVLKGFIAFLFILDTLHTILCSHSLYWYLVLNFGNVDNLDTIVWSLDTQLCVNGVIGYLVQIFYARRVYILSGAIVIPMVVVILGGIFCSLTFAFTIRASMHPHFSQVSSLKQEVLVGLSTGAMADILIALAMCWYLSHKRTGFSRTDSIISTLMTYSINSGLLTSILATCTLVAFVINPQKLYPDVFFWLMGKCYVNSFLAILNNRDNLRAQPESSMFQMELPQQNKKSYQPNISPTAVAITMHGAATANFATSTGSYAYNSEQEYVKSEAIIMPSVYNGSPA